MGRTHMGYVCACMCVFIQLVGSSTEGSPPEPNSEHPRQSSADVIMREDAEEMFYSIDLEKYDGIRCSDPIPPENGAIVCRSIRCPDPTPPENGAIIGEGNEVGSVVYVQCHKGYRLEGPAVLACVPTSGGAQWNANEPRLCVELAEKDSTHETAFSVAMKSGTEPGIQSSSQEQIRMPVSIDPAQHVRLQANSHSAIVSHELLEPDSGGENSFPQHCLDKPEVGPCRASFKRYYFSNTTLECHTFIYGGCHGNQNNFHTMIDCNRACLGHE